MKFIVVLCWSLFMAVPGIAFLYSLSFIGALESGGPTTGGSMEGIVVIIGLGGLFFSGLILVFLLKVRPENALFTPASSIVGGIAAIAAITLAWELPRRASNYTLTARVLDSEKRPVQAAKFSYYISQRRPVLGGSTTVASGVMLSDAQGEVTLRVSHLASIIGAFRKEGYRNAQFAIDAEQAKKLSYWISWDRSDLPPGHNANALHSHFDAHEQFTLIVFLPGNTDGNKMPYILKDGDSIWPQPNQARGCVKTF